MVKILCPTDFSDVAFNAINYAAKFCKEAGAELTLFYVESMDEASNSEFLRGKSMTLEAEAEKIEELCQYISATFTISCYSEIRLSSGSLPKMISAIAEDFDLIIMGTNGASDFFKSFSGSNTYRVIRASTVPVLCIPPGYNYSSINSIVYAFDYFHDYKLPVEQLKVLMKNFNCKLTVLQITEPLDKKREYELKEIQRQLKNIYQDEISLDFDTIRDKQIAKSIDDYVSENGADLLALCTHDYNIWEKVFHKSIIKSISSKANYPVYVFHN